MQGFDFSIFLEPFALRAVIVGVLVALCASLLGVTLVLQGFAMIGDGLSHVAFSTLAIAAALNIAPLGFSIPATIVVALLMLKLSESSGIMGDSMIAVVSIGALGIGILVASFSRGANIDLNSYLFGSILAVNTTELWASIILAAVVLTVLVLFYNTIFAVTFDESFARSAGIKVSVCKMVTAMLTAVIIVIGMRIMGTLLISSLIIFPSLTVMRLCKSFRGTMVFSAIVSVFGILTGIVLSFCFSLPVGATIVTVNFAMFIISAGTIRDAYLISVRVSFLFLPQ